ncbi:hypothetical protein EW026_g6809 [Hermanssonia centrifuga]|uniref:Uncharacterized protein n=1 Tax=Hermanssonia centrifuga TaxID=98765 RepID=A0A4S4K9V4_9APHY|nr:hypothetical protein EW026_g6809 [Hermanssonia centrifuga]
MPNQSAERENASNPGDYGRDLEVGDIAAEEEGEGSQLQRLGLKCMPPAVLPPSPPLTVVDSRDEPEGSANSKASGSALPTELRATSPPMGEKDIADWRVSMGGDEQDERDHQDQAEDEYDPYDLGYSTGVTPVTPVGPSAHRLRHSTEDGTIEEMSEDMPSMQSARNQEAHDHPLRLDVHPPSPLPWEVINPPDINAGTRADGMDGTLYPLDTRSGFAQPLYVLLLLYLLVDTQRYFYSA